MKNKNLIKIIIGIAVIVFAFYWFQLRPSNIKKNCVQEIESGSSGSVYEKYLKETGQINLGSPDVEGKYKTCLARYGL